MTEPTKILVTDDDPEILALTTKLLRRTGYEVLEASTGGECLEAVRAHHPDLVLLDVVLPDITGVEVCRRIKTDQQTRDTFVILVSGVHVSSDSQADGLNVGADGYIVKPISNKELVARVQAMVRIKRAEDALQASELRYRRLFETAQDGILILDAATGEIVDVNPFLTNMLGYTRQELLGRKLWELGAFKDVGASKAAFEELQRTEYVRYEDLPLTTKDGRGVAVAFVSNVYLVNRHKVIQCNIRDITERKQADEQIRASLKEKEVLLKEIYHRVKNNLQIVSSLLSLQASRTKNPEALSALLESHDRIRSMSRIHEKLSQSSNLASVDMREYTRSLVSDLRGSYGADNSSIRLTVNFEDFSLNVAKAIPVGLIINELASNALKHAFPKERKGEITIELHRGGAKQITLMVGDNGIGFPEEIDFRNSPSLGLTLVNSLVTQLGGTIELDRTNGTVFTITVG